MGKKAPDDIDNMSDEREYFEERAAIRQFHGHMPKVEAERSAHDDLRKYGERRKEERQLRIANETKKAQEKK